MSKNALSITVTTTDWLSFNFLPDWTRNGNCTSVQPNTIWRSSHHCGFVGISTTTIPGLSPVASCSAGVSGNGFPYGIESSFSKAAMARLGKRQR